jgi:predicted RNase H-like nuclease (RuvC/YqgF family)
MERNSLKTFDRKTSESISKYCEVNNITDVDKFIFKCFKKGFDIERYGLLGQTEIITEVPVEVIREVEKIVEVPVEKIVTKVEYISDKNTEKELTESITKMKEEMSKKDEDLDELRRTLDIFRQTLDEKNDDTQTKMLQETLQKLRKELLDKNKQIEELEKINKDLKDESNKKIAVYLRGSNINQKL